ncbi:MAG: short-chain dehydrogenase, partial [Myxococcota bacterium]|nr:short-chain dehydrogenase [Myxococcota bacterium]
AGPPYDAFAMEGGSTLYGSTKAFLERMTAGMAAEFFSASIAVNSLAPVAAVLTPGALAIGVIPDEHKATAEPVECMAESALALCEPTEPILTGRIVYSKPLLEELGREVRTLDGTAVHVS